MTVKIWSWTPKSGVIVPPAHEYIYASLVKIHQLVLKITHGKEATLTEGIYTKNDMSPHSSRRGGGGHNDVMILLMAT